MSRFMFLTVAACLLVACAAPSWSGSDERQCARTLVEARIDKVGARSDLNILGDFMAETLADIPGPPPLKGVEQVLREPISLLDLPSKFKSGKGALASLLDEWRPGTEAPDRASTENGWSREPLPEIPDGQVLAAIMKHVEYARTRLRQALADIDPQSRRRVMRLLPTLLDRTANGSDLTEFDDGAALVDAIRRVDSERLETVAALLMGLTEPDLEQALLQEFQDRPARQPPEWLVSFVEGTVVYAEQTAHGPIIVGGPGDNHYNGPAALVVDLGGNDRYALPQGNGVRVIVDLDGNDRYLGHADGQTGGAIFGASLLVDHAGNDIYSAGRIAQGAAVLGVGLLVDHGGDDTYHAQELVQGAALGGIGMLLDRSGHDQYAAAKFAQGFGGALGAGLLHDESGNDRYLAGNKHASSYGEAGRFQAFSQGVGFGFRGSIAGGVGLLVDEGGNDRYRGGNFSQGTGYYLGLGVLLDNAGDDHYRAARYGQGAAAHLGAGMLKDRAGDDDYTGLAAANMGGAWDSSVAALADCAGDDRYHAREFALGAAAHASAGLFLDAGGNDQYEAARNSFGHSGPTDYHDQDATPGNVAVFIDQAGPSRDSAGEEHNDTATVTSANSRKEFEQ